MDILTRAEFIDLVETLYSLQNINDPIHPLWIPETTRYSMKIHCEYFVQVSPIKVALKEYWQWCDDTLHGQVRCFISSVDSEYWGFTDERDIVIWRLKWVH